MAVVVPSPPGRRVVADTLPHAVPLFEITGPSILPDDIFELGQEDQDQGQVLPRIQEAQLRDRTHRPPAEGDEEDFEQKLTRYDLDAVDQENRDRDLAPDEFVSLVRDLDNLYLSPFKEKNDADLRKYVYQLWDLEEVLKDKVLELVDIYKGYEKNLSQILKIYMLFLRHKMVGKDSAETIWNQNLFNRALKSIYYMQNILISEYHIRKNVEDENFMGQEDSLNIFRFTPEDVSKNKPFQNLLIFLLNRAYQKGYRLYREGCYKQIYYDGYPTHAWKFVMTLPAFIYDSVPRETNGEMWRNLTDAKDNVKRAVDYLLNSKDKEFPALQPDRHLFAWTDGLYDAKVMTFYDYKKYSLPSDRVAVKFFEQPFKPDEIFKYADWYDIPTEGIQKILDDQRFTPDVCRIMYAMIGRCLYNVGEMDRWEVVMFIKGVAGSGKSTIGKILKDFYHPTDIAVLSSNIERKFGLAAIYDKLMFLCFEVKASWNLDQGDFQCMISGEELPIAVKHKTAFTTLWTVPGMLMGNEVARSWLDAAGSMTRRILVAEFNYRIRNTDTTLGHRIKETMAATLHKCNMAYHALVRYTGSSSLWDKLPPYFLETRRNLSTNINPLEHFLADCDTIQLAPDDPTCCIPYEEFQMLYLAFCRNNNYDRAAIRFNKDVWATTFDNHGIIVKQEAEKEYRGMTKRNIRWIYGVGRKEEDDMIEN